MKGFVSRSLRSDLTDVAPDESNQDFDYADPGNSFCEYEEGEWEESQYPAPVSFPADNPTLSTQSQEPLLQRGRNEDPALFLQKLAEQTERWRRSERERPRLTSGLSALDAVLGRARRGASGDEIGLCWHDKGRSTASSPRSDMDPSSFGEAGGVDPGPQTPVHGVFPGGWPLGKVAELVGPDSSGRTTVAMTTVAAATARGEVVAWIDAADAFDPPSAAAFGVELDRVLWVRPRGIEQTVRVAELVIEVGGFSVLVLDVAGVTGGVARSRERERRVSLGLRLARTVEKAKAVALVLNSRPWLGTATGVVVNFEMGQVVWGGTRGPRWLAGLRLVVEVGRDVMGGKEWSATQMQPMRRRVAG